MTKEPLDKLAIEICCPVETRVLSMVRSMTTAVAKDLNFTEEQIDQIEMAVDEACANVVEHAYEPRTQESENTDQKAVEKDPPDYFMQLRIIVGDQFLKISIIDHGVGMNNRPPGCSSVEEFAEKGGGGGLGNLIIRNFMDEVDYHYPPGSGTILTMTKYRRDSSKES